MTWRNNRYTARPAARNRAARIAWDEMSRRAALMDPPRTIQKLWFAPEMDDGVWNAYLNEIHAEEDFPYIEMDVLEVRDRMNNPHKYAANDSAQATQPGAANG